MESVSLNHVFNYISPIIRQQLNDDDQFKSWAAQGLRTLKLTDGFVKDIAFLEVANHKATLPADYKKAISMRRYVETVVCADCLTSDIELPNYDSFAQPINVSMEYFISSHYYEDCWAPVIRTQNLESDYLCRVENGACDDLYSLKPGSNVITFSFLEGTVALEYYKNATDCLGDLLLPREPEELWLYLGATATFKYWDQQFILGKDGALQKRSLYQQEMGNLRSDAKKSFMLKNINLNLHRHLTYEEMRIGKVPSFQQRLQNWRANV